MTRIDAVDKKLISVKIDISDRSSTRPFLDSVTFLPHTGRINPSSSLRDCRVACVFNDL